MSSSDIRTRSGRHSRILGVGAYRPRRVVTNEEVCQFVDSSDEWIRERTGIIVRRFASPDETLHKMATIAGKAALADANIEAKSIDCVITASTSNVMQLPPLSVQVAHSVDATNAGAFDISVACAGFCQALAVASDMIRAGNAEHVLVVATERMSDLVDPADRSTSIIFGDGAGAAVVGPSAFPGIGPVVRGADGSAADSLTMTRSWETIRDNPGEPVPVMCMDGRRVFRWTISQIVPQCHRALELAGVSLEDLAIFIPHQANLRIIEIIAEKLRLPSHVLVCDDVTETGNTSAASIPMALARLRETKRVESGSLALVIGFGAGLSFAGQVIRLP